MLKQRNRGKRLIQTTPPQQTITKKNEYEKIKKSLDKMDVYELAVISNYISISLLRKFKEEQDEDKDIDKELSDVFYPKKMKYTNNHASSNNDTNDDDNTNNKSSSQKKQHIQVEDEDEDKDGTDSKSK
jgi:hypothetical protein